MLNYRGFENRRRIHSDLQGAVRVLGFGLQADRSGLVIGVARVGENIQNGREAHGVGTGAAKSR
jgi:hypothetical protein